MRSACRFFPAAFALAALAMPAHARAADVPGFEGRYGHAATSEPGETVWNIRRHDGAWQVQLATENAAQPARELEPAARAAFWQRMMWPAATARDARCLAWGSAPATLDDLLADQSNDSVDAGQGGTRDFGASVLCHVPRAARLQIDWLASHGSDWFYYDAMSGVMELDALR